MRSPIASAALVFSLTIFSCSTTRPDVGAGAGQYSGAGSSSLYVGAKQGEPSRAVTLASGGYIIRIRPMAMGGVRGTPPGSG